MKSMLAVVGIIGWLGQCGPVALPRQIPHYDRAATAGTGAEPDAAIDEPDDVAADGGIPNQAGPCQGPPGLYAAGSCQALAEGVQPYRPNYPLWSDDAEKERFIYLPSGTQIETENPDRWTFPKGTRLYKTFSLSGVRLETRLLEKVADDPGIDSWTLTAYQWNEDQDGVSLADPDGVPDALGTQHDIPSQAQCRGCHTMPGLDVANGFGAVQLNHDGPGITLKQLIAEDLLINPEGEPNVSVETAVIPGDASAKAALGYMHANCGNCHGGPSPRVGLTLWMPVGTLDVASAPALTTGGCACLSRWTGRENPAGEPYEVRIAPGHAAISGIVGRMSVRGMGEQMPPFGTEQVDPDGVFAVSTFIDALDDAGCIPALACADPTPVQAPAE